MTDRTEHIGITPDGTFVRATEPGGGPEVMENMHAVVCVNDDGGEGIVAIRNGEEGMMPLIGFSQELMERYLPIAKAMADVAGGRTVRLVRFTGREVLVEIPPSA